VMVTVVGLALVGACVLLARVARGSKLYGVFTTLGAWLAVLLVLYELGMSW
jgi:hypothetical protein